VLLSQSVVSTPKVLQFDEEGTCSGCKVEEWIPYSWRHSLMILAISENFGRDALDTTTWEVASAFSSLSGKRAE
jgi:hypothetical protein